MNRKLLAAVIIPILLVPLASFAYAHWTDTVFKRYKFRFGTVEVEIVKWHVDLVKGWDADSDGHILGSEVNVTEVLYLDEEVIGLLIDSDPVGPGFEIQISMLVHNKGRLPVEVYAPEILIGNLTSEDPCFEPLTSNETWPEWLEYTYQYYKHEVTVTHDVKGCFNASHYTSTVDPTGKIYEPSESVLITQKIVLDVQDYPDLQCHYFRIDVTIPIRNANVGTDSSLSGSEGWP